MKLYEYCFLKICHGPVNQDDFILPEYNMPTNNTPTNNTPTIIHQNVISCPLQELKLTFDKDDSKKISTLFLPTNDIPNINSKTINFTK